jgi:hypothetical protein
MSYVREKEVGEAFARTVSRENVIQFDALECRMYGTLEGQRGGVIPPGWWIALPEVINARQRSVHVGKGKAPTDYSIKLVPFRLQGMDPNIFGECARGGFYIHGASRDTSSIGSGSDGCILFSPHERKWLAMKIPRHSRYLEIEIGEKRIYRDLASTDLSRQRPWPNGRFPSILF